MGGLKNFFSNNGLTILIGFIFHYAVINQILYLFFKSANPHFWPWLTGVIVLPDFLIRYPPLMAWLFLTGVGLVLFAFGHFWRKDEIISFGLRLTGLVIVWFMLMFSVPIDVLKFLHSFSF